MIRSPDQTVELAALAVAEPDAALLAEVVQAALGEVGAEVRSAVARPTGYAYSSIATGGLFRVTGTAATPGGDRPWSVFVKVLHHPRHWHLIDVIPPAAAEEIKTIFPWREELETRAQVLPVLPDGLRVPETYRVADLGDDRLAVWMEDIDVDDDPWSDETYARAAFLLARLAARRRPGTAAGTSELPPGLAVRKVVESRAPMLAGLVADDAAWARPVVRDHVDPSLRADLSRALDRLPGLLAEMATLPSSLPHGDAAPVNLLRPRGEADSYVAVDWAFGCQLPLGHDLGQLLVGDAERGRMDPARLSALLDDVLVPAYVDGLGAEGLALDAAVVRRGAVCSSLGPRTLFGAFPFELVEGPVPPDGVVLDRRAGLARFVVDLVLDGC
jgi:hypothetical protein